MRPAMLTPKEVMYVSAVLTNDEASTDDELVRLFQAELDLDLATATRIIGQRGAALMYPLSFELDVA
jgi:hypothetical protein